MSSFDDIVAIVEIHRRRWNMEATGIVNEIVDLIVTYGRDRVLRLDFRLV